MSIDESLQLIGSSSSLFMKIINDDVTFITTEGHRESSVEILRCLLKRSFSKENVSCNEEQINVLQSLFRKCSHLFEKRMSRDEGGMEQSEHIRLALVELMTELGTYLTTHNDVEQIQLCEDASRICHTLARDVFKDPFPDILLASCKLVQTLARLSPPAVGETATELLLQLAGNDVKHCLFGHRRSKIRSEAVETSSAIVLCLCYQSSRNNDDPSIQEALQNILLPGWEELIKMDSSVPVRLAVLRAVRVTAEQFDWSYSPTVTVEHDKESTPSIESHLLSLFVSGISDGNVQVQEVALQQMYASGCLGKGETAVNWDVISRYFNPLIETVLASCSLSLTTCMGRVRSLEALQVCLSFVLAITDVDEPCLTLPRIKPIVECLRRNIIDTDENDVLQAALKACEILGESKFPSLILTMMVEPNEERFELSKDAVAMILTPRECSSTMLFLSRMVKGLLCHDKGSEILSRLDPTFVVSTPDWIYSSPSSMVAITMLLSHPKVTNSVAENPSLAWGLLESVSEVIKCCTHHLNSREEVDKGPWTLKEESVLDILISIVHLLGCPDTFGLSTKTVKILEDFSSCFLSDVDADDTVTAKKEATLLDDYFCKVVPKIVATAETEFPWKESDASFQSMRALLRAVNGSTISSNFDVVAPFFMHHISNSDIAQDEEAEEYSLRITMMSLLQSILADKTFHSAGCSPSTKIAPSRIILSLTLPHLAWRPGGLASALRKIGIATVYSLLSNLEGVSETSVLQTDTLTRLIPILHSCLEDTESSTRELSCVSLSMVLEQASSEVIRKILKTNLRVIDTLEPSLLNLLDDSHNPVRLAACRTLRLLFTLRPLSEKAISRLIIHLDDDEKDIKEQVHGVLEFVINLIIRNISSDCEQARVCSEKLMVMAKHFLLDALHTHRDKSYLNRLLGLVT